MESHKKINMNGKLYYGKHLILGAEGCNVEILDENAISDFLRELVVNIQMLPYGDPLVKRFGTGIKVGITGYQMIYSSAISVHTNDFARDMHLDVFSCEDFDEDVVVSVVKKFFNPVATSYQVLLRK